MYEHIYYMNPNYECIPEGDELICVNCQSGNWIKLNESSANFLRHIGEKTLNQILEELSKELVFPLEAIRKIYDPIIINLITSELILNKESTEKIIPESIFDSNNTTYPKQIWIHIIDTCNLACNYCYYCAKQYIGENGIACINTKTLFSFLGSIPDGEREKITISGGEPFLNAELQQIVIHLKENLKFKEIIVISNGTVNHDQYKYVLPYIDWLQLSMDGTTKEIHDTTRGRGSFEMLLKGIQMAIDCGFKGLRLSFSVHNDNLVELKTLPLFAYEKGITSIHVNKLLKVGKNIQEREQAISPEEFKRAISNFRSNLRDMNSRILYEREIQQVGIKERRPFITYTNSFDIYDKIAIAGKHIGCGMGVGMISIDADGTIYPCPSLHHIEFAIGSLDTAYETVKKNGAEFSLEYNVENEKTECHTCKYKFFCGGGCRAEALANQNIYGRYEGCDHFYTELLRGIKEF